MRIRKIARPWQKKYNQGNRYNADPFYHTPEWKRTRRAFIASYTIIPANPDNPQPSQRVSNRLCLECFKQGKIMEMHTVDHILPIRLGGNKTDHNNLQSLCMRHHAQKSAREAQITKPNNYGE